MIGTYYHSLDTKGRLSIPARLRDDLGEVFYVMRSLEPCLTAYSIERWDSAMEKLKTMTQEEWIRMRPLFSLAAKCEIDVQGRILIPQNLRDKVGLKRDVTIVGTGLYVQFWDSDAYRPIEEEEADPENIAKVIREYGF
jgi:MraZ protein